MHILHSRISSLQLPFLWICGITVLLYFICLEQDFSFHLEGRDQSRLPSDCFLSSEDFEVYDNCLDGYLTGPAANAGIGNLINEFIIYLALAKYSQRVPLLSDKKIVERYNMTRKWFPNLEPHFKLFTKRHCNVSRSFHFGTCCTYNRQLVEELRDYNSSGAHIHSYYLFAHKYFKLLPQCYIRHLLKGSAEVERAARYDIFRTIASEANMTNLCIQIRRGDYVNNAYYNVPNASEIRQAADFILEENPTLKDIYVMGNDVKFNEDLFKGRKNVHIESVDLIRPTVAQWEFSRMYCDVFFMTASSSSYAYWGAYLSRGQKVYYNADCCRGDLRKQTRDSDFFPPEWIALNMTENAVRAVKLF